MNRHHPYGGYENTTRRGLPPTGPGPDRSQRFGERGGGFRGRGGGRGGGGFQRGGFGFSRGGPPPPFNHAQIGASSNQNDSNHDNYPGTIPSEDGEGSLEGTLRLEIIAQDQLPGIGEPPSLRRL